MCVCVKILRETERERGEMRNEEAERQREKGHFAPYVHCGSFELWWAAVCLENKSQWSSFPEGLTRQSYCVGV